MIGEQERLIAALNKLHDLTREIVCTAEERSHHRCPLTNARDECTFAARCQNQTIQPSGRFKCTRKELTNE